MTQILNILADKTHYPTRTQALRVNLMYGMIIIMTLLGVAFMIIGTINEIEGVPLYPILAIAVILFSYVLVRNGYLLLASWVFFITLAIIVTSSSIGNGVLPHRQLLLNAALVVMSGFLLETRGIIVFLAYSILQMSLYPEIAGLENNGSYDWDIRLPSILLYLIIAFVIYMYNRLAIASQLTGQDLESNERVKLAEINAQITQQASIRGSLDKALNTTLDLILKNYDDIYHAQVFLIDDDGVQANLMASTGDAGQQLLSRNHSLAVGSLSVIGQTTFTGEAVISQANARNSVHRINELLPNTTLEVAFPLRVNEQIIGALDLQSTVLDDLSENDRVTFQSLANSLSLAIDSIRQFEQAQSRIEENQRLAEQTRTALREVERLNQRLIGRAWSEYTKEIDNIGYTVDFSNQETNIYKDWTTTLADAVQSNNLVQDNNVIAIPLRVRGQVIGAMEFELNDNQEFSPEDLDLIMEVSDRFGLAAENTRLVEESQQTAQREMLINQITGRFQSAQNVESTLAEAARSLSETLGTNKVMIRLGVPDQTSNGKDN